MRNCKGKYEGKIELKKYPQLRYCKVQKGTKKPFEKLWTDKPYTWQEINETIKDGYNYGVLCGLGGLAVIDSDNPAFQKVIEQELPDTYRVRTGSGGIHNYFFIPELKSKIILTTLVGDKEIHWGEVQSYGTQVVGPGSLHPNKSFYEEVNKVPIFQITLAQLTSAIKPFRREVQEVEISAKEDVNTYGSEIDELSVENIWGIAGMKKQGSEYYGVHLVHGSDTGMNFWINPLKNIWHCFRCNSGGGPLAAIAVKEGIISCSEAQRGVLRGDKAIQAIRLARQQYGLRDTFKSPLMAPDSSIKMTSGELTLWKYKDFETLKKDTNFLVDEVIYPKTVNMIYSPPGEFKSIICLLMAMAVASGNNWLRFKTQPQPVLYCDKENNDQIIKARLVSLFKGENFTDKELPLYILRRNGDLLNDKFIKQLRKEIKEKEIKVVFFDTLHRFADYDENRSDDINRLYSFVFQPLIEEFGISIIFLHHTKKDGGYRGSGDFLGMVDTAYGIYREKNAGKKTNKFRLVNEKCRSGEIDEIFGEIDFGEDYIKVVRLNIEAEQEKGISKLKELTQKVMSIIKSGEALRKKDIEDRLEMEEFDYSVATLKRCLKWMSENNYLNKEDGKYSLI